MRTTSCDNSRHVMSTTGSRDKEAGTSSSAGSQEASSASADSTIIVVIDQRVLIRDCLARCLRPLGRNHTVYTFANVAEWQESAARYPRPAVIILSIQGRKHPEIETERELALLSRSQMNIPVVLVSDAEDVEHVLFALDGGARGYIPTSVSLDVAVEAMLLVKAGGTFVPASSLISWRRKGESGTPGHTNGHGMFTARQAAVVDAVRQGKANKRIAYELNMRESTVKVHIRNIMKKLKAKNRTEVAFLTSGLFNNGGTEP